MLPKQQIFHGLHHVIIKVQAFCLYKRRQNMKIATKALATLLIVTVMTTGIATSVSAAPVGNVGSELKLERLQQHHDRKLELRASILGMSAEDLRDELKEKTFDQILKKHGFKDRHAFHKAMAGKLKDELMRRGWSEKKIEQYIEKRMKRLMQ
jgi:hypothetical protein